MNDPLATYLQDHLAGARMAVDLLAAVRDQDTGEPLSRFATELLVEVDEDRAALKQLIGRLGMERSKSKEAIAWAGEKATRIKLRRQAGSGLGAFQALETLALGILGKLALWRALAALAVLDSRLREIDFDRLAARAQDQHTKVEQRRLETARTVFKVASH